MLATSKWRRERVSTVELAARSITDQVERLYVGGESVTDATAGVKYLSWNSWPCTAGELARQYLRHVYADIVHRAPSPHAKGFEIPAPLYCLPVRHRELAYVDITSAFWQIMRNYRPDDIPLRSGMAVGKASWWRSEELGEDRRLRHAVAGAVFSNRVEWYERGQRRQAWATRKWCNPALRRVVMETLHGAARDVLDAVTLYGWLTDAAIVDVADVPTVLAILADRWYLGATVRAQGEGALWSVTSYVVGDKVTADIRNGNATPASLDRAGGSPYAGLVRVNRRWLRTIRARAVKGKHEDRRATGPYQRAGERGGGDH